MQLLTMFECLVFSGLSGSLADSAIFVSGKLRAMKNVHLLITDLFLPVDFAAEVCKGLHLPALEKLLARGVPVSPAHSKGESSSLEDALCGMFAVSCEAGAPVAPISAVFDGLGAGCWLRADPVHLRLQREQVVLLPNVEISAPDALLLCDSLNAHFDGQGMEFFAPHPQRWYVRLEAVPDVQMMPLSQASGRNIHGNLPTGAEARRWHQLFNEIQMLLFAHPLNEAREERGELPVNSVWFWGGGNSQVLVQSSYDTVSSDEMLAQMLAASSGLPFTEWSSEWHPGAESSSRLLVWTGLRSALQRGDLSAWRDALQDFETGYAQPLWQALRAGKIDSLQLDVLGGDGLRQSRLTRGDAWSVWRRPKRLADYSVESTHHI